MIVTLQARRFVWLIIQGLQEKEREKLMDLNIVLILIFIIGFQLFSQTKTCLKVICS